MAQPWTVNQHAHSWVGLNQCFAVSLQVSIVGDLDLAELDALAPRYLGTIQAQGPRPELKPAPLTIQRPAPSDRVQAWHLKDSDERAFAYIAGAQTISVFPAGMLGSCFSSVSFF